MQDVSLAHNGHRYISGFLLIYTIKIKYEDETFKDKTAV